MSGAVSDRQLGRPGSWSGLPGAWVSLRPPRRLRRDLHRDPHQVGARDAVDHGVVELAQQCLPALAQPLDHPHLPQRLAAVEPLHHDPGDQLAELLVTAGSGKAGMTDVVLEVEVRVVDPHRAPEIEGHRPDHLAVARDLRQLAADQGEHVGVRRRRPSKIDTDAT